MMKTWLLFALLTIVFWGCMGFFGKLASRTLPVQAVPVYAALGGAVVFVLFALACFPQVRFGQMGSGGGLALLAGAVGTAGTLAFYIALARGQAATVVALTATYPIVTLLLALLFLREPLTLQKYLGVAFAVTGTILLALGGRGTP